MHHSTIRLLNALLWFTEEATLEALSGLTALSGRHPNRQQMLRLEKDDHLYRQKNRAGQWVFRLTEKGKLAAAGGRIPPQAWSRPWDGKWRFLIFDLPARETRIRKQLQRWLRLHRLGRLQGSVWVSPDSLVEAGTRIREFVHRPESILVIEGGPPANAKLHDRDIVDAAWDFKEINRRYQTYLSLSRRFRRGKLSLDDQIEDLQHWMSALEIDPLLPTALLPPGYLGKTAWTRRRKLLGL